MGRTLRVGVVLLLALGTFASSAFAQQGGSGQQGRRGGLRQNYPNPFNPETRIPFELLPEWFENGQPVRVTIRIFNTLREPVASPHALNHLAGDRTRVENLEYTTPGVHEAHWDGLTRDGRKVASGRYFVVLVVNGRRKNVVPITVAK